MKTFHVIGAGLLLVGSAACNSMTPSATAPSALASPSTALENRSNLPTIAGVAQSAGFTYLVAALEKAGYVDMFNGNVHYTVFAPTNAAFDAAARALLTDPTKTGPDLVAALSVAQLQAVLKYHVTRGDRNSTSVVAAESLRMLDGNTAPIAVSNGAVTIDDATITAVDIRASNGIVHVIDAVILPN